MVALLFQISPRTMKLWQKDYNISDRIERFTVGNDRELDLQLAKYDVLGSQAHAHMLAKVGLITSKENESLQLALTQLLAEIEAGEFIIEDSFEDVHSKVEHWLTEKLGVAGKKIHTARSRNDQVLVDLHLWVKDTIQLVVEEIKVLFDKLLMLAKAHEKKGMPGYTHMQVAMPSSFGLWFSAYAETLIDDVILFNAAHKIADQNPLGSAAGYGSSFPIDRYETTKRLSFHTLRYSAVAAQMSRGRLEKSMAYAIASVSGTLNKLATDICLYMGQDFGFLTFPDHLTTGSSIMPHKKNPDVWELIRGQTNRLQSVPTELHMMTTNQPSGYHRDFQLLKEVIIPASNTLQSCLDLASFMLDHIVVKDQLLHQSKYDLLYTVEAVNSLVVSGIPFRDAYRSVGADIESGTYQANRDMHHTHEGSLGNLCIKEIREKMSQV